MDIFCSTSGSFRDRRQRLIELPLISFGAREDCSSDPKPCAFRPSQINQHCVVAFANVRLEWVAGRCISDHGCLLRANRVITLWRRAASGQKEEMSAKELGCVEGADPTPTGRQIIEGAGFRKAEEHLVFQVLRNGELEELRLEETTDLCPGQVEHFLVFPSADSYRFDIDGKRLEWGHKVISGRVLKKLAGVDPAKFAVWQVIPGKDDILVGDTDLICLADAGLEHFFTGVSQTTEGGAA